MRNFFHFRTHILRDFQPPIFHGWGSLRLQQHHPTQARRLDSDCLWASILDDMKDQFSWNNDIPQATTRIRICLINESKKMSIHLRKANYDLASSSLIDERSSSPMEGFAKGDIAGEPAFPGCFPGRENRAARLCDSEVFGG